MTSPFAEVIGDPISHSKSPAIHQFWLAALGIDADYRATCVSSPTLADFVDRRRGEPGWRGCNVTLPHKLAVMDLVEDPGDVRQSIGAMNTLVRRPDGTVFGTNTDAAGFYAPLSGIALHGADVVIIGSGGAAHAVLFALGRAGVGHVTILARNAMKGASLLARFGLKGAVLPIRAAVPSAALLVNASPLGMVGQAPLDVDMSALPDDAIVYDLVYAPLRTSLLRAAQARGLDMIDGLDMLIGQAAVAFELFFGQAPPRERDGALRTLLTS